MSDDRRHTPARGLPIRMPTGGRLPPRDSGDVLRDLSHAIESLGERFSHDIDMLAERFERDHTALCERLESRLSRGAETFTRLDEQIKQAIAEAHAAKKATEVKPLRWTTIIPIIMLLLTPLITVVIKLDHKVSDDEFKAEIESVQQNDRLLEGRLSNAEKELAVLRQVINDLKNSTDTINSSLKITPRRPR